MKKKIIKFYFFKIKDYKMYPSSLIYFSKKALYQNRQLVKYNKPKQTKKQKKELFDEVIKYKFFIRNQIKLKQWSKNKIIFKFFFFRSFFYSPIWFKRSKKYKWNLFFQLKLWFLFKIKFNRFIRQFIINTPKLGFITSQTTHTLSRKNLMYQTRSKYKSKLYNMNFYNKWFYYNVKFNNLYFLSLLRMLYSCSINPSLRSLYYDECFSITKTKSINLNSYNNYSPIKNFLNYNYSYTTGPICINLDYLNLYFLLKNLNLVENILLESDKKKQDELQKNLEIKYNIKIDFIILRFFVFNDDESFFSNYNLYLYVFICNYILIYK